MEIELLSDEYEVRRFAGMHNIVIQYLYNACFGR